MKRIVVTAVILAALAPAALGAFKGIQAKGKGGHLSEVDGEVILYTGGVNVQSASDWDLTEPSDGTRIGLRAGKLYGHQLGYDLEGKNPSIRLARGKGDGRQWQITSVKGNWVSGYVIRAAEGKYKGWYLDAGDEVKSGRKVIGRKAVLTEKPKKPLVFSIYEIGG